MSDTKPADAQSNDKPVATKTAAQQLRTKVKDRVKDLSSNGKGALEVVVDKMADKEVERRAVVLQQALTKLNDLEGQLKKVKPDVVTYDEDADGKEVERKSMSKGVRDSRNKLRDKLKKLDGALAPVLAAREVAEGEKKPNLAEVFQKLEAVLAKS